MTIKLNYDQIVPFSTFEGLTFKSVNLINNEFANSELIEFKTICGRTFSMAHLQDCCEYVYVDDIVGDLDDIVGTPILNAESVKSSDVGEPLNESDESYTWTFYKVSTIKGSITIRWYGASNGYYSESVDVMETTGLIDE